MTRDIKTMAGSVTTVTGKCSPPVQLHQNFMAFPKIHRIPLRPIVSSRGPSHMEWPRSWPTSFVLGWSVPTPFKKHPTLHATHQGGKAGMRRGQDII